MLRNVAEFPLTASIARSASRRARGQSAKSRCTFAGPMASDAAPAVVSGAWLQENLKSVKVVDATWYMPGSGKDPLADFTALRIPGAVFFDVDGIKDVNDPLPHMLPPAPAFAAAMDAVGISHGDHVVIYDCSGLFSAARAWWLLRAFGHPRVSILDGGLPLWQLEARPLDRSAPAVPASAGGAASAAAQRPPAPSAPPAPRYPAALRPELYRSQQQVLDLVVDRKAEQLVDARGAARFQGTAPEPRAGVRSGHVPGSSNVPFTDVLTADGRLKADSELRAVFATAGVDLSGPLVCSCGTGVTAGVLALALYSIGRADVAVFDGSWTQWGSSPDTPVEIS